MALTALPDPPETADPANFATKADALVAALAVMVTEINAGGAQTSTLGGSGRMPRSDSAGGPLVDDANSPTCDPSGNVTLAGTLTLASAVLGAWTTPAFSAGDYTSPTGSWTVAAGDVTTMAYTILYGKMTVAFVLATTSVGTTPAELRMTIPASKTATKAMRALIQLSDNGTATTGLARTQAGITYIAITRLDEANFANSTDATLVAGEITFEIN